MIQVLRYISPILLLAILLACGSDKEETVNYSDLSPNGKKHHFEDDKDTVDLKRPEKSAFFALSDTLLPNASWQMWDSLLFPDRFGAIESEKWILKSESDSVIALSYVFKDSLKTKNAFFNWIDCFGAKCTSYSIGDNIKVKNKYAYFLVGAKQLVYIEGSRKMKEEIIRQSFYPKPKQENWIYLVQINPKGKSVWKRIVAGEELPIIKDGMEL